ncbi:MAG: energy-coupling factor transporter transmembrane component T [Pseudomonadota bacterium]
MPRIDEMRYPHPIARLVATGLGIAGVLLTNNLPLLAVGVFFGVMPIMLVAGTIRPFLRFVLAVVLPIAIALLFVWGWLVGAPPGVPIGSAPIEGMAYAGVISLRLILLGGIGQLCLMTVRPGDLPATLRSIGIKGDALVIALASYALVPELRLRMEQVITARHARGLLPNRNVITRIKHFPFMLRPLFGWVLRSALQRTETWRQRGLRFDTMGNVLHVSQKHSAMVIALSLLWVSAVLFTKYV